MVKNPDKLPEKQNKKNVNKVETTKEQIKSKISVVLNKKSNGDLLKQAKKFLSYAVNNNYIEEEISDKIYQILSSDDNSYLNDESEVRNALKGILTKEELNRLLEQYNDYLYIYDSIKECFIDLEVIPKGCEFIFEELIHYLIKDIGSKEDAIHNLKNLKDSPQELFTEIRNQIERNVALLSELPGNKKNIAKLVPIIIDDKSDEVENMIEELGEMEFGTIEDLIKIKDILCSSHNKIPNMRIFYDAGIKSPEDFEKLTDIITSHKFNGDIVNELIKIGINSIEDFIKLQEIICNYNVKVENLKSFTNLGIKATDDLIKLKDIILNSSLKVKNVKTFGEIGIKTADDFIKLKNLICDTELDYRTIKALPTYGINTADDFQRLENILYNYNFKSEYLLSLADMGIKSTDDLSDVQEFIIKYPMAIENISKKIKYFGALSKEDIKKILKIMVDSNSLFLFETLKKLYQESGEIPNKSKELLDTYDYLKNYSNLSRSNIEHKICILSYYGFSVDEIKKFCKKCPGFTSDNVGGLNLILETNPEISIDELCKINITIDKNTQVLNLILKKFPNITVDEINQLKTLIEGGTFQVIEMIYDKYPNITLNDFLTSNYIFTRKPAKVQMVLYKIPNISFEDLNSLQYFLSSAKTDNLGAILNEYNNITVDKLKLFDSCLSKGDSEVLKIIIEKYPNINHEEIIKLKVVIESAVPENLKYLFEKYPNTTIDELTYLNDVLKLSSSDNLQTILEFYPNITFEEIKSCLNLLQLSASDNLKSFLGKNQNIEIEKLKSMTKVLLNANNKNFKVILFCCNNISLEDYEELLPILKGANPYILNFIAKKYPEILSSELRPLETVLTSASQKNFERVFEYFNEIEIDEIKNYEKLYMFDASLPEDVIFKEENHKDYLKYLNEIIDLFNEYNSVKITNEDKSAVVKTILGLPTKKINPFLDSFKKYCFGKGLLYTDFIKCFDGEKFSEESLKFLSFGFDEINNSIQDDKEMINYAINKLYPQLDIYFSDDEAKKIISFLEKTGGINKGYTIIILTLEKLLIDGINKNNLPKILCDRIDEYEKIIGLYPEDKVPKGLKISVGLEFEMTNLYLDWYNETTGKNYLTEVDKIINHAKVGIEREGLYEFATKPSTNPMTALLEIHLLQELNLLDLNDMLKLSGSTDKLDYKSRNGTGYHLNVGSDADIGVNPNINFIQNLCAILPRSGISNGDNVHEINHYSNVNSKASAFPLFSEPQGKKYIELRTYSADNVELFEKNVLFNTYAIMGNQAQTKTTNCTYDEIIDLKNTEAISSLEEVYTILEHKNYFKKNQDTKSKKIAAEFVFMQISVLKAIDDYNKNFIDNELLGDKISENLPSSWKSYFLDFLLSDRQETIGYEDMGISTLIVKKYTNLKDTFSIDNYLNKDTPFTQNETKEQLEKFGNKVDDKRIPYITTWLNKKVLWKIISRGVENTDELQDEINNKITNIDRIKSYIRGNDKNLKVDIVYLRNYFSKKLSLIQYNLYHGISGDYMNRIINLNNFFLKKDDTNANNVLKVTKFGGEDELDISKQSIFESGFMRKGYHYYQGGTKNMLLHKMQNIAQDYMNNVVNILNSD